MLKRISMNEGKKLYNDGFFESLKQINLTQAQTIVPIICSLVDFNSVIDFGCGVGCWLKAFGEYKQISNIKGLDGEWLRGKELLIDRDLVEYRDLSKEIRLDNRYDLVVSVEVAEHLPENAADIFIDNLTNAGNLILFSAAIPWQGGTGHINEQWPEYWENKFSARSFDCYDVIRPLCWDKDEAGIYRQNLMLYIKRSEAEKYHKVLQAEKNTKAMRNVVAPFLYNTFMKKHASLIETVLMFIEKESIGNGLDQYLKNRGVSSVAVYGMAELGCTLVKYLRNKGISVTCGIDKKQMDDICGISVFQPGELKGRKPKFVISTVPNAYDDIVKTLGQIEGECEVVDIHSILKEI